MAYESKAIRPSSNARPPAYWHCAWERAIHRFCRRYETTKDLPRGSTPLSAVQSFSDEWYRNKDYRIRANQLVECEVCKADSEAAKEGGMAWPAIPPAEVRERAKNFGIRFGGNAVAHQ